MELFLLYLLLFFKGIIIGFAVAAPVGPIGILCIRRSFLNHQVLAGVTGLGAACADTFYSAIAAFSLAGIADLIAKYNFYLKFFGGIIIAFIGLAILRNPGFKSDQALSTKDSSFHAFTSAFFLTLSNPLTLIVFAAAFSAMGINPLHESFFQASLLVLGVFIGACSWWASLIIFTLRMHHKFSEEQLSWINRFSGAILIGFAVYILGSLWG